MVRPRWGDPALEPHVSPMTRATPALPSPSNLERLQKSFFSLALLVLVVLVLHSAKVVLVPVALAVLLSFALTPPAGWLEYHGLKRYFSVPIVMIGALTLLGTAGWVAGK